MTRCGAGSVPVPGALGSTDGDGGRAARHLGEQLVEVVDATLGGVVEQRQDGLGAGLGVGERTVRSRVDDAERVGQRVQGRDCGADVDVAGEPTHRVEHVHVGQVEADTGELGPEHGHVTADVVGHQHDPFVVAGQQFDQFGATASKVRSSRQRGHR